MGINIWKNYLLFNCKTEFVKTLTNKNIWFRTPSPDTYPADGPPDQFIDPWTSDNPVYLKFASDGVSVAENYKLTYNIALNEDDEKNGRTWFKLSTLLDDLIKNWNFD